ncbi:hypothetical protein [Natrialba taiwanensis]|uniref:Small CPxCG-related zinc finger protein n=1 Tax=Natrialba taiwanensis DSM 12281 TaxID=1230458 RepID=L9ZJE1_9EURY|nr:hypothetical protein [Natrialba taiwanensis]ELY85288.1 hypothetical protein C484_20647 [Natrialba taiwanensis DSM 12281]
MSRTTYTCHCGAVIQYNHDLEKESGTVSRNWNCADCGTRVPSTIAERIQHQHPT